MSLQSKYYIKPSQIHSVLIFCALIFFCNAFMSMFISETDTGRTTYVIWAFCYLVIVSIVVFELRKLDYDIFVSHIGLLLFICFLSSIWSTDPPTTFRKSITLLFSSYSAVVLVQKYSFWQVARLMSRLIFLFAAISFILYLVKRDLVVMHDLHEGAMSGIFNHKNWFSRILVLGIIFNIYLVSKSKDAWYYYIVNVFYLFLIILSESSGSLGIMVLGYIILLISRLFLRVKEKTIIIFIIVNLVFLICFLVSQYFGEILELFGKNETLTGRTLLWVLVIQEIAKEPILGYGFEGFWTGETGASRYLYAESNWLAPHAHNAFLDIWLDIGIFGVLVMLIGYIMTIKMAVINFIRSRSEQALCIMIILLLLFVVNIVESLLLSPNNIFWILYIYCFLYLHKDRAFLS